MDRERAKTISREVVALLQDFAAKNGLRVQVGGSRYSDVMSRFRVEFHETGAEAQAKEEARARDNWKLDAPLLDPPLPEDAFGKVVKIGPHEFRLNAVKLGRQRYPVTGFRVADGKAFKFGASTVARALALPGGLR